MDRFVYMNMLCSGQIKYLKMNCTSFEPLSQIFHCIHFFMLKPTTCCKWLQSIGSTRDAVTHCYVLGKDNAISHIGAKQPTRCGGPGYTTLWRGLFYCSPFGRCPFCCWSILEQTFLTQISRK